MPTAPRRRPTTPRRRPPVCPPPPEEGETSGEIGRSRRRGGRRQRRRRPQEQEESEESETGADPEVKKARAALKRKKKIAQILKRAKGRRRKIKNLKINQPLGWSKTVERLKKALKADMEALKALGWKPKKPKKDGQTSDEGEELDDEPEPDDADLDDGGDPDGEASTEGDHAVDPTNWLDDDVFGVDKPKPWQALTNLLKKPFGKPAPLGDAAEVRARAGHRAVVMPVKPGLYLVSVVSDQAVRRLGAMEGVEVGLLPALVFAPKMVAKVREVFTPHPAPGQAVAPPTQPTPPVTAGCDCPNCRR